MPLTECGCSICRARLVRTRAVQQWRWRDGPTEVIDGDFKVFVDRGATWPYTGDACAIMDSMREMAKKGELPAGTYSFSFGW